MVKEDRMTERPENPIYYGITKHVDQEGGYAIWVPNNWTLFPMKEGRKGVIFSPYKDNFETCFLAESFRLKVSVIDADLPILQKAFEDGIRQLPGVEIEETKGDGVKDAIILEAKFTFIEGEHRRKRWVRNLYWGNGQLVFIAQGSNIEEFQYWLPMFFNIMMTFELT
jgi:hypothetical protein